MEGVKKGETQGLTACATQVAVRVIEVALAAARCGAGGGGTAMAAMMESGMEST